MNTKSQARWHLIALLLATLPMLGSCATRWGGGSGTVIDAETKAPMAGVHVLIYLSKVTLPSFPFSRSTQSCGPEFYAVSDAQGRFTIPEDALDQPWEFSLTRQSNHVNVVAYQRGYIEGVKIEGVNQTGYGDVKAGPLKVTIVMKKDTRTSYERALWLTDFTAVGCGCTDAHRAIALELKQIAPLAERDEAARRGQPWIGGPGLLPQRECREK